MRVVLVLLAFACLALASSSVFKVSPIIKVDADRNDLAPQADSKTCEICIDVAVDIINVALNYILQGGVVDNCADLCGIFNSTVLNTICNLGCDAIGIDAFAQLLKRTDLDPILYCQVVDMCKVLDCTGECANITEFVPTPQEGFQDTQFTINCAINVTQPAGTGMIQFLLYPEGDPNKAMADTILMYQWNPGYYTFSIGLVPDQGGLPPGNWTIELMACEGECGSKHEHSAIFSAESSWLLWNKDTKKPFPVQRLPQRR